MGLFKDNSEKTWEKALKALEKEKWAKALPLVKKVADEGLSSAQYQYALLLEQGLGTAPDAAEAALWYEKAAQQKHLKAMLTMARLLLQSPETCGNTAKAYTWYQTVYEIMENRFFADSERDDLQSKMEAIQEKALDERQTATDRAHEAYESERYYASQRPRRLQRLRPGIQIYKKSRPKRQRLRSVSLRRYVFIWNGHGRKRRARL